ncbi:MAG TPA: YggS family pyridoxal phosphate-dependent enzyme [Nitriliruptorales bacterium]|nr:YggS family pyridoxal phosphate-dependent enzyme [Nitriliruptorales bacterium]
MALPGRADDAAEPGFLPRLEDVRRCIADACRRSGRSPAAVTIVAVTKTHPPEVARTAVAAGVTDLGEARVQELLAKMSQVDGARWHMVGRLQRNKARQLVGRGVLVHSLDRRELADELSRRAADAGVLQRALVQVNVAGDASKAGCHPDEALDLVGYARQLPNLAIEGLMTIGPLPEHGGAGPDARACFTRLRGLRDRARARWAEVTHLSMGMSGDFETAVEAGATIVRLGTVLFGPRRDAGPGGGARRRTGGGAARPSTVASWPASGGPDDG